MAECSEGDRLALFLHGFPSAGIPGASSSRCSRPRLPRVGAGPPRLRRDRPSKGVQAYAIEHLMDDVAGLIDAARPRETVLIAHDWGGVIAWLFAMRKVRPLDRLVVMNLPRRRRWSASSAPGGSFRGPGTCSSKILLVARAAHARGRLSRSPQAFRGMAIDKSRFPSDVLRVYRDNAARPGALTAMLNYYRAFIRGGASRRRSSAIRRSTYRRS